MNDASQQQPEPQASDRYAIIRHRHETRRRRLSIARTEQVTPGMRRLVLVGEELAGFTSLSPDDHIKLFVPSRDGEADARRDYTPRRYDATTGELWLDFALHDAGPATDWARGAQPGDTVEIGGPRGSAVIPNDFDWSLLIGDETALPAIGRRIEELPAGAEVISLVAVGGPEDEQLFVSPAKHRAHWVHRPSARADEPDFLLDALAGLSLPPGEGFVWIAAEANVARALRRYVLEQWGHPGSWLKASGYWIKGQADAQEKF